MLYFIVSSSTLLLGLGGLAAISLGVIFFLRWLLHRRMQHQPWLSDTFSIKERNKYNAVNAFRWSSTFFMIALVLSLSAVLMAFNWTQFDARPVASDTLFEIEDIVMQVPRTTTPPPTLPPPPPSVIEEILDEELEEEDISFVDMLIEEETPVIAPPTPTKKTMPPPPVAPPPPKIDETIDFIFVAEQMPRFPGCEEKMMNDAERKQCAEKELLTFLGRNLNYPPIARENGIKGTCVVQFTITKEGEVQDVELLRDIGGNCGEEAVRVVKLMAEKDLIWTPGKQRGRPVPVRMTLPIKFKLQ